eukprot:GHVO01050283.1.p1 GENE.GHVO01050283.1~~GHVO01050283.1.p1  ORF type:complete len:483 (-),score=75.82 GHVO01050283.1:83-1531(-)
MMERPILWGHKTLQTWRGVPSTHRPRLSPPTPPAHTRHPMWREVPPTLLTPLPTKITGRVWGGFPPPPAPMNRLIPHHLNVRPGEGYGGPQQAAVYAPYGIHPNGWVQDGRLISYDDGGMHEGVAGQHKQPGMEHMIQMQHPQPSPDQKQPATPDPTKPPGHMEGNKKGTDPPHRLTPPFQNEESGHMVPHVGGEDGNPMQTHPQLVQTNMIYALPHHREATEMEGIQGMHYIHAPNNPNMWGRPVWGGGQFRPVMSHQPIRHLESNSIATNEFAGSPDFALPPGQSKMPPHDPQSTQGDQYHKLQRPSPDGSDTRMEQPGHPHMEQPGVYSVNYMRRPPPMMVPLQAGVVHHYQPGMMNPNPTGSSPDAPTAAYSPEVPTQPFYPHGPAMHAGPFPNRNAFQRPMGPIHGGLMNAPPSRYEVYNMPVGWNVMSQGQGHDVAYIAPSGPLTSGPMQPANVPLKSPLTAPMTDGGAHGNARMR